MKQGSPTPGPEVSSIPHPLARGLDGSYACRYAWGMPSETVAQIPPVVLSLSDVAHLTAHKGVFEEGYDDEDALRVLSSFTDVNLILMWDYHDSDGFGGGVEILGRATGDNEPWRALHPGVLRYLTDPDCLLDPATIPSLLEGVAAPGQESLGNLDDGTQTAREYEAVEECAADDCDDDMTDNEGYDGFCGTHADLIAQHDDGEHPDGLNSECPDCGGL